MVDEKPRSRYTINNWLSWITLVLLIFSLLWFFYYQRKMETPINAMVVHSAIVDGSPVKAGDWVKYRLKYDVIISLVGDNDRRLIGSDREGNEIQISLMSGDSYKKILGKHDVIVYARVPEITPEGIYHIHTTVNWPVTYRNYQPVSYDTTAFEVIR